jgi:hypothetical protein
VGVALVFIAALYYASGAAYVVEWKRAASLPKPVEEAAEPRVAAHS